MCLISYCFSNPNDFFFTFDSVCLCSGFEAEHHERALNGIPRVRFRIDHQAKRFGVLTTEDVKYAMMTLFNNLLREQRVSFYKPFVSENPEALMKRIAQQLEVYSFQYKSAANVFGKQRAALSGKVGGMKDDIVIALQLGAYFSKDPNFYT